MKPVKKLTRGLFALTLAGALTLGLAACNKWDSAILTRPSQVAGQTLDIYVFNVDPYSTERIDLYEDGKLIESKQRSKETEDYKMCKLEKVIRHEEPGEHSYCARIFYKNGKSEDTKLKEIIFLGTPLDIPPEIGFVHIFKEDSGKPYEFFFSVRDNSGDNKGISSVKVYEDGKRLQFFRCFLTEKPRLAYDIYIDLHPEKKKGMHVYQFEVEDKGGNKTSKTLKIDYDTNVIKHYKNER